MYAVEKIDIRYLRHLINITIIKFVESTNSQLSSMLVKAAVDYSFVSP